MWVSDKIEPPRHTTRRKFRNIFACKEKRKIYPPGRILLRDTTRAFRFERRRLISRSNTYIYIYHNRSSNIFFGYLDNV